MKAIFRRNANHATKPKPVSEDYFETRWLHTDDARPVDETASQAVPLFPDMIYMKQKLGAYRVDNGMYRIEHVQELEAHMKLMPTYTRFKQLFTRDEVLDIFAGFEQALEPTHDSMPKKHFSHVAEQAGQHEKTFYGHKPPQSIAHDFQPGILEELGGCQASLNDAKRLMRKVLGPLCPNMRIA